METIAKKVVQNWAAKGYISDDEVEMCLYNLIRHAFTVAVLCVLTVAGALLYEWSNTIVLIVSILFLRTYTNGYHCKSCVACIFLSLAVTLLSLHIVPLLNFITALILMFVGSSIILAIAPTNSPQMHTFIDFNDFIFTVCACQYGKGVLHSCGSGCCGYFIAHSTA